MDPIWDLNFPKSQHFAPTFACIFPLKSTFFNVIFTVIPRVFGPRGPLVASLSRLHHSQGFLSTFSAMAGGGGKPREMNEWLGGGGGYPQELLP